MAGLHAIQKYGQIMNNDIKARNILYYEVDPGGYWVYKIEGIKFYVPNYGKLYVLNDFGVSTLYDPKFEIYPRKESKTFNLGSRYAINMNGFFSPIESKYELVRGKIKETTKIAWNPSETSKGATFRLQKKDKKVFSSKTILNPEQKLYLHKRGCTTGTRNKGFFQKPLLIPPFEFYNDTQDVIKTFIGGKRSTQKGNHSKFKNISNRVVESLKPFVGLTDRAREKIFYKEAYYVLAGEFILKFFTSKACNYRVKLTGKRLGYYSI